MSCLYQLRGWEASMYVVYIFTTIAVYVTPPFKLCTFRQTYLHAYAHAFQANPFLYEARH
jgi:hypothetical protein